VLELIKKYKERVALIGMGVAFLIFIGGGIYLQKSKKLEKDPPVAARQVHPEQSHEQQAQAGMQPRQATRTSTAYFLKPSPDELLEQLASMENLTEDAIGEKFTQLSVLWPAYFFTLRETEDGRRSIVLDVSEDGFGVVIESDVDLNLYPQVGQLARGERIWIGGKILAVDPAGTGTIYLATEQLEIGDDPPFSPVPPVEEKKNQ
jgi:uncharacterized protein YneF (UPF0154 family)